MGRWTDVKRFAFLAAMLVIALLLGLLASYLTSGNVAYNWRSVKDYERWTNWNLVGYLIFIVVMYLPFLYVMLVHRSNLSRYEELKVQRPTYAVAGIVCVFLLAVAAMLVCAFYNPHIGEHVIFTHIAILMVPLFYALILFLSLVTNNKLGSWYW